MTEVDIKEGMKINTVTLHETTTVTSLNGSDIIAVGQGADLKHITYNNFSSPFQTGIDNASTSTVPAAGINTYNVSSPGTYTNFLDSSSTAITVTSDDLESGLVQLRKINGAWVKIIIPVSVDTGAYKNAVDGEIPADTNVLLFNEGDYISGKTSIASYTLSGLISISNGAFSALANRPASDFIDITGYTHILHNHPTINTATGTAFYDASQVFISGVANSGASDGSTWQSIKIPASAKYVRYCSTNIANRAVFGYVNISIDDNEILAIGSDGSTKLFNVTQGAIVFASTTDAVDKAVAYKPGIYVIKNDVQDLTAFAAGYVNYSTGAFVSSANYKVSGYISVSGYTHFILSGLISGTAGICFYDASQTYLTGIQATAPDLNTPIEYAISLGAVYVRVSMHNSSTNKYFAMLKKVTVDENQLAFIEDGNAVIYSGGSGSSGITGNELIADLPVSDGSDIDVGDAYIEGETGIVKIKLV